MVQLIKTELIELDLKATERESAILELIQLLDNEGYLLSKEEFHQDVMKREELGNTAVGFGVAIPHGKSKAVKEAAIVFGRSQTGVDWNSFDGSLVNTVFLLAVPGLEASDQHLRILALLSRALINDEFREALSAAQTSEEVLQILEGVTQ